MRLIDADALLQEFETENTKSDSDLWHITGIKAFIDNQPTAYDVEKIVEQLEENCISPSDYPGYVIDLELACDIIRAGGKE